MFTGFNLTIDKKFFASLENSIETYKSLGEEQLNKYNATCETNLKKFIIEEEEISGTKLQEDWFPQIKADIFISHSHIDEELALILAGWLSSEFNLTCFIDSCVWGHSDTLLENLNNKYSNKRKNPKGGFLYSYNSCNKVSQHVNMMLNVALHKMIDKTEAIFLLNTSNSIEKFDDDEINKTYSPWLYSELICSALIEKKPLFTYRSAPMCESENQDNKIKIVYDIPVNHLIDLSKDDLKNWKEKKSTNLYSSYPINEINLENEINLDTLYKIKINNNEGD